MITKTETNIKKKFLNTKTLILVVLVITLFSNFGTAQFYPAKVYSIRDGMPTNAIYDITQSKDGIMWFLTAKGVVNYNSLDWHIFPDSLALPSTPYSFIRSCNDGSIWVAGQNNTSFVIQYYQDNNWRKINIPQLPKIEHGFSFDVKKELIGYSIIICNRTTTYTYNTKTKKLKSTVISEDKDFQINAVNFKNNTTYLLTTEGLFTSDSLIKPHQVNALIRGDKEVLQMHWMGDDLLLLGLGWLGKYTRNEFSYLSTETGIDRKSPLNKHNLTTDQLGRIFYSSNTAAKYFDKESEVGKTLYVNGRVFNALSNKIFIDRENNVWVGDHRGLFKLDVLRFKNYNENTGLANNEVSAIIQREDEIILANTTHLNLLKNGSITNQLVVDNAIGTRVLDMAKDKYDNIYIAANTAGLNIYDGKHINKINWDASSNELAIAAVEMVNDHLYFCSNHTLFSLIDNEAKKEISSPGLRNLQLLDGDTLAALSSSDGILLYNTLNGDTIRFTSPDRKYNNVYAITKWRGTYYIGTAGGIATIKDGMITPMYIDSKLNRVAIYSLMISENERLWMGSNEGVFIWDGSNLTNYNKSYGLVGDEVNRNAFIQDDKGKIWIGTEMGASVYNYDEDKNLKIKPLLILHKPSTQKGTIIKEGKRALEYDDNTIEFDFLAISFFDEKQITYRYKLQGFDSDWIYIDNPNSNAVRYTNLAPGDYAFTVESGISGKNWSEPESVKFSIKKPFYASIWFIFLVIISLIALLYIIYRIRFYVILKNQKKLQREVIASTWEIQEMNKEIQAQNEALRRKSEEIVTTNEMLEITVFERTRQLREQNEKLSEYAFINSHELRAPICRMIGLLNLLPITKKEEHDEILELIHLTGNELDQVTKNINKLLDNVDLTELEELNSIEVMNAEIRDRLKDIPE